MDVVGLCAACQRPGRLMGCPTCGQQVHPECLTGGLHMHGTMHAHGNVPPHRHDTPDFERPKA